MLAAPNHIKLIKQKTPLLIGLLVFSVLIIPFSVYAQSGSIPDWIKNTASFWATGQISDGEFINAIEFLIGSGIIEVPGVEVMGADQEITIGFIRLKLFYPLKL